MGILQLVQHLNASIVYPECSNFETNVKLWKYYAKDWKPDADYVLKIANGTQVEIIGDEWASAEDVEYIVERFIKPYLSGKAMVGEIGSGGGRIAKRVCASVEKLVCFDICEEMLEAAKRNMGESGNVEFQLLKEPKLGYENHFDFMYAFDVFVHVDLHMIWNYLQQIKMALKPKGRVFFSTANVTAEKGWERFSKQEKYSAGGFYFVCPEMVDFLIVKSGLVKIQQGECENGNIYLMRDYLVVAEKPE